jgi:hypothetical protein
VEVLPFAGAARGAELVPDSGPGSGRIADGCIEPPELDESTSVSLRLPAVSLGFCWETGVSSRSEPVCWSDTCALADASAAAFLFWAAIYFFICFRMLPIVPQNGP